MKRRAAKITSQSFEFDLILSLLWFHEASTSILAAQFAKRVLRYALYKSCGQARQTLTDEERPFRLTIDVLLYWARHSEAHLNVLSPCLHSNFPLVIPEVAGCFLILADFHER